MATTPTTCRGVDGLQPIDPDLHWQELTDAVARACPGRPAAPDGPCVLGRLEALAAPLAGRSPSLRRQVIDDAPGVIFQAFNSFQRSRPFTPWAQRVLRNHAVSLYRRQRKLRPDPLC